MSDEDAGSLRELEATNLIWDYAITHNIWFIGYDDFERDGKIQLYFADECRSVEENLQKFQQDTSEARNISFDFFVDRPVYFTSFAGP